MEQRNIILEEASDKARAWEVAWRQATNMTMNSVVMDSVNAVKTKQGKGDDKPRKCYNCGREEHLAIGRSCPAKGKNCAKCGRYGHFALCCQGKSYNNIMQLEVKQISDRGVLIYISLTMLTLWAIRIHLTVRITVLLHLQLQRIKEKHAMQLLLKNQCWK